MYCMDVMVQRHCNFKSNVNVNNIQTFLFWIDIFLFGCHFGPRKMFEQFANGHLFHRELSERTI